MLSSWLVGRVCRGPLPGERGPSELLDIGSRSAAAFAW